MILGIALYSLSLICIGFMLQLSIAKYREHKARDVEEWKPVNDIPIEVVDIAGQQLDILDRRLIEWNTVIQTQMHFNDLIIKFRSVALTTYVALIGGAIAVSRVLSLPLETFIFLLFLPAGFWASAFLLDYFYYHKLLLGSVAQARKFDNWKYAEVNGFFGLTKCISQHIRGPTSKQLVRLYYTIPIVLLVGVSSAWYLFGR
jgi:hypothetical protein